MSDLDVTYFQVMEPRAWPNGVRATVALGPMFETPEQGREFLRRIRPDHPHAYMVRAEWYIDDMREADFMNREELLNEIVPADEWGAEAFGESLTSHVAPPAAGGARSCSPFDYSSPRV